MDPIKQGPQQRRLFCFDAQIISPPFTFASFLRVVGIYDLLYTCNYISQFFNLLASLNREKIRVLSKNSDSTDCGDKGTKDGLQKIE
jgi:hypothetical protein